MSISEAGCSQSHKSPGQAAGTEPGVRGLLGGGQQLQGLPPFCLQTGSHGMFSPGVGRIASLLCLKNSLSPPFSLLSALPPSGKVLVFSFFLTFHFISEYRQLTML